MTNIDMMYLSMLSILLPAIMAVAVFKRLPISLKILSFFIFVTCLMEGLVYLTYQLGINNMPIFHVYTYLEFISISLIYFYIFRSSRVMKWLILLFVMSFIVLSSINIFLGEQATVFNSFQRFVEYGFLMVYFVVFLSKIVASREAPFLELHPYFVLTVGFLIYFTGTLLLFLNVNQLKEWGIVDYWMIHGILNIFLNIIYFAVLWNGSKVAKLL